MSETTEAPAQPKPIAKLGPGVDSFEVLASIPLDEPTSKVSFTSEFMPTTNEGEKNGNNVSNENKKEVKEEGQKEVLLKPEDGPEKQEEIPSKEGEEVKAPTPPTSDIPDETVFTFKAAKGEVTVPLKELKASYQSRAERDRLFGAFQKEKLHWEEDRKLVDSRFSDLAKGLKENPWETVNKLCTLYKINPAEVLPIHLAQAKKTLDELGKLPEEQQRIMFAKMGLDWDAKQLESVKAEEQMRQATKQDEEYLDSLKSKFNIADEELDGAWEIIQKVPNLNLDKKSKRETIDLVTNYITQFHRPYLKIESALSKVDKTLLNDAELKKELRSLITPDISEEEIVEVIEAYLGKDSASSVNGKVEVNPSKAPEKKAESKANPSKAPQAKAKPKQTRENDEDDIFDLDELVQSYKR